MSISGPRDFLRRASDEVGRMRFVSLVVERRRGIRTRPMLPEADVMRMDFGDIVGDVVWKLLEKIVLLTGDLVGQIDDMRQLDCHDKIFESQEVWLPLYQGALHIAGNLLPHSLV